MRVIARHVLLAYARAHAETAIPLERWYRLVKAANWTSMDDIRHAAPKSKVLDIVIAPALISLVETIG